MIIEIDAPQPNSVSVATAGLQGPAGMVVVSHGTNGNTARPVGVPFVYWVGTATPVNATAYDFWDNG